MTKIFQPLFGNTMEAYIDDMLVKSKERFDHTKHLQEAFELLQRYGMKLNPLNCAFEVNSDKFLGFMVTQRGIEANPIQLKAIMDSQALTSRKRIQQLTVRLTALGQFISCFTERLKPFLSLLGEPKRLTGTGNATKPLSSIKQYLTEPSILASPGVDDTL